MGDDMKIKVFDMSHGSAFDRGGADAYYERQPRPHIWPNGDHTKESENLTAQQIEQYHYGFKVVFDSGNRKKWD